MPPVPPEARTHARVDLVERARQTWLARLIDTSRRNNLLFFRTLKTGTLDLSEAPAECLESIVAGDEMPLRALWNGPDADLTAIAAKAREIARRAFANEEERGIQTLFVALGMASWPLQDGGRPTESAVVLIPVEIAGRLAEGRNLSIKRKGEAQLNLALTHVLETSHGKQISAEEVLADADTSSLAGVREVIRRVGRIAADIEGFQVSERAVIGNFSFQKLAMVRDLRADVEQLSTHDLIAALAGDLPSRESVGNASSQNNVAIEDVDRIPADEEFLVLDADSSQQRVVASVLRGQSGIIQGPPGTGKSQTISNLIASLAARGKRVLFVAEKRAALEVVMERLSSAGLNHLYLDLHGAELSQRNVMQKVRAALEVVGSVPPVSTGEAHARFENRRAKLNEHVERLHTRRAPSNMSVFEMQAALLRNGHRPLTRWRGEALASLDPSVSRRVHDVLTEAATQHDLVLATNSSPWTLARIENGQAAQELTLVAREFAALDLPAVRREAEELVRKLGGPTLRTLSDVANAAELVRTASDLLQRYSQELFTPTAERYATAFLRCRSSRFGRITCWFRPAFHTARGYFARLCEVPIPVGQLAADLSHAADLRQKWSSTFDRPIRSVETRGLVDAFASATSKLSVLNASLQAPDTTSTMQAVQDWADALAADSVTPFRLPRCRYLLAELSSLGVDSILRELRTASVSPAEWVSFFDASYLWSCLEDARASDPMIAGFNGRHHATIVEEFRQLDASRIELAVDRVRRAHAERVVNVLNSYPEQAALVRREAEKKTRHLPLRKLVAAAPNVLTTLTPCWMASPLSVSQLLPNDRQFFDVVLFDEGSQVLPEDAIPALLRAERVVIAGDQHQLPPTTFFADGSVDRAH
ncbi:MAG: AAA domain-containing protein [Thermoanaerobaculia bacterium]